MSGSVFVGSALHYAVHRRLGFLRQHLERDARLGRRRARLEREAAALARYRLDFEWCNPHVDRAMLWTALPRSDSSQAGS